MKILLLGLAYKRNVEDIRESPSLQIIELLEHRGAKVDFHDPYVPHIPATRQYRRLAGRKSVPLIPKIIAEYDAAVIVTDHENVDYGLLVDHAKLVIDTRNAVARVAKRRSPNVCKA